MGQTEFLLLDSDETSLSIVKDPATGLIHLNALIACGFYEKGLEGLGLTFLYV